MSIVERQARQQATIRRAILDAALSIAAAEGWEAVTMRRIAERIEYSPATLYAHFPAKRDLMAVLARLGFATLADRLSQVRDTAPERRLRALAALIWDFAFANRALYDLTAAETIFAPDAPPPEALAVLRTLGEAVAGVAGITRTDLDELTDLLWAAITGLIAQTRLGRVAGGTARARHLLDRAVGDHMAVWRAR